MPESKPSAAPFPAPITVCVTTTELPPHDPLDLYTGLLRELGPQEVFLFESLAGPGQDCRSAAVGYGRLAELRLFAGHVEIDGAPALRTTLTTAAENLGMTVEADHPDSAVRRLRFGSAQSPWELLRRAQGLFSLQTPLSPDGYAFGFLTTLAYESAWHMEALPAREGDRGGPDLTLTLFRETVWYDLRGDGVRRLSAEAEAFPPAPAVDLAALLAAVRPAPACPPAPAPRSVSDSVERDTFLGWARRCLEHIRVGDIYQIQIGHRIDVDCALTPVEVYRRLRERNPSPYMYLAPRAEQTLIGASPELLLRVEGGEIVMRPIAGTARRHPSEEENERQVKELLASEKEQAEHVMLVDLCRNDIGRVCRPGTLDVEGLMTVETFSHVFHLVSTVTGRLEQGVDTWQAVGATFPAGTMTGAPKLRAMEIIQEIEQEPRGIYAGAVGLVDVRGWSELALCIRTIVHDGRIYSTQSSAGIVAASTPEAEWNETLVKMGAAYWALTGEELSA